MPHTSTHILLAPAEELEPTASTNDANSIIWLQRDAAYLYMHATRYRIAAEHGELGSAWVAAQIQMNAAYSAKFARKHMGMPY